MIPKARARIMGLMFCSFVAGWTLIAILVPEQRAAFFSFVSATAVTVGSLILREMNPSPQPPAAPAPPEVPKT